MKRLRAYTSHPKISWSTITGRRYVPTLAPGKPKPSGFGPTREMIERSAARSRRW
jgi:hypothetical protein